MGSKLLNKDQRQEMKIFSEVPDGKILDYVAAWYLVASKYIQNTYIKAAFCFTNSITQGGTGWYCGMNCLPATV
ncbi:MAG: DNA methyltransferase [Desulfobacterales bacterium]